MGEAQIIYEIFKLIDCEIDCIKSGNTMFPQEQCAAIESCKNIKRRINGHFEKEEVKDGEL